MSDWALHGPISLWFDTHYNHDAFMVLRSGLTYHLESGPELTAGYAHMWADPGDGTLTRNEHRPWGQVFMPFTFSNRWSVTQRLRFDLRVREAVEQGALAPGWMVMPRWRSQTAVSYWLPQRSTLARWFVQVACELLVNSGRNAGPIFLDQNRLSAMAGVRIPPITLRVGYMDRFVPGRADETPTHAHNAVLWVNYRFKPPPRGAIAPPEAENP